MFLDKLSLATITPCHPSQIRNIGEYTIRGSKNLMRVCVCLTTLELGMMTNALYRACIVFMSATCV